MPYIRSLLRTTVALVAPPLADTIIFTVNFDVLSHPVKLMITSPTALCDGARLPSASGKVPGAIVGLHAVPPVSVSVTLLICAEFAAPSPVL